jgi:gluconolactonase
VSRLSLSANLEVYVKVRIQLSSALLFVLLASALSAIAQQPPALIRLDPALDAIISPGAKIEKLTEGYRFTEGPVWVRRPGAPGDGYLLFSDIPANKIHKWSPDGTVSTYMERTGFTGDDYTGVGREVKEPNGEVFFNLGSNGITLDKQGRVTSYASSRTASAPCSRIATKASA